MKKFILTTFALALFVSCQSEDTDTVTDNEPVTVEFEEIAKGQWLGGYFTPSGDFAVNTQANWDTFITGLQLESPNAVSSAVIDFDVETAVVVLDPVRPVLGYNTTITAITKYNDSVVVTVVRVVPSEDQPAATEECRPYHVVKMPKTMLPVVFEEQ